MPSLELRVSDEVLGAASQWDLTSSPADQMDGGGFEGGVDSLSLAKGKMGEGLAGHVGGEREAAVQLQLEKRPHGGNLDDPSRIDVPHAALL